MCAGRPGRPFETMKDTPRRLFAAIASGEARMIILLSVTVGTVLGGVAYAAGESDIADVIWAVTSLLGLLPLSLFVARDLAALAADTLRHVKVKAVLLA